MIAFSVFRIGALHLLLASPDTSSLPTPLGNKPIGYSITSFKHVKLPLGSLLGDLGPVPNPRTHFLSEIWRIGVGSVALTSVVIPSLNVAAYITAQYSMRRKVSTPQGGMVPIISFRTQQAPILHALVQAIVLEAFYKELRSHFTKRDAATLVQRNAFSTIFKAIAIAHWRQSSMSLADRCGARGLFGRNQIVALQVSKRQYHPSGNANLMVWFPDGNPRCNYR